jgi:hypothetical protein
MKINTELVDTLLLQGFYVLVSFWFWLVHHCRKKISGLKVVNGSHHSTSCCGTGRVGTVLQIV